MELECKGLFENPLLILLAWIGCGHGARVVVIHDIPLAFPNSFMALKVAKEEFCNKLSVHLLPCLFFHCRQQQQQHPALTLSSGGGTNCSSRGLHFSFEEIQGQFFNACNVVESALY